MAGRNTAPKSSAVTPAEAGVQPGQCQTRVFTQTLKPRRYKACVIISASRALRSPAHAGLRSAAEPQPSVFCGSEFDVDALHAGEAALGVR
jgi:hypothetical protein